jgi:MFS family permease
MAGDLADYFGRRFTVIAGCFVFMIGNALQTASRGLGLVSRITDRDGRTLTCASNSW